MRCLLACLMVLVLASSARSQTTQPDQASAPATQPSQPPAADQLLNQMLAPGGSNSDSQTPGLIPQTSGAPASPPPATTSAAAAAPTINAVAPGADATTTLIREGTDIIDRIGRMRKLPDSDEEEFDFDSDGKALHDPPVILLPNLELMLMERAVGAASHDLRFRITGTVTEYHGRNYILLEKFVVVQDLEQQF
ncbi:MAG TPA: hypothetical protein VL992_08875 [Tepidisphaeraceae bacterium]|nr:hypothetical protein [Tepidisphaeraceae bacterium]